MNDRIGLSRLSPAERYRRDPHFATLVDTLQAHMLDPAHYTPTELREAVMLAAIMFEDRRMRMVFIDRGDQIASRVVDTERFERHRARTDIDLSWVLEELRLTAQAIREQGTKGRGPEVWLEEVATVIEARMVQQDPTIPPNTGIYLSRRLLEAEGFRHVGDEIASVFRRYAREQGVDADVVHVRALRELPALRPEVERWARDARDRHHARVAEANRQDPRLNDRKVLVHATHELKDGQCQQCMILITESGISSPCISAR